MLHSISYGPRAETYTWFEARLENGVMQVPESGLELAAAAAPARGGA
jgi:CRISPR-associated protein Cas5d